MAVSLTFSFSNPNPPELVEQILRRILLEKLMRDSGAEPPAGNGH